MVLQEDRSTSRTRRQGLYWMLTIPSQLGHDFDNPGYTLPEQVRYLKGQMERGESTGYEHWQVLAVFVRKTSLQGCKSVFGQGIHCELTRSQAANEYVWKEDTSLGICFG